MLAISLRHPTLEAYLAELRRNETLRKLIGIESEERVPRKWNVSRFLETLGQDPHRMKSLQCPGRRLGEAVPRLGVHTAGVATALNAR